MKKVLNLLNKAVWVCFLPLAVTAAVYLCSLFLRLTEYSAASVSVILVIIACMVFYSAFKQCFIHDADARSLYFDDPEKTFGAKLKLIYSRRDFPALWLFTALMFYIIPLKPFANVFASGKTDPVSRLKILGFCLPVFFILATVASLTAVSDWKKQGNDQKKYTLSAFFEQIAIIAVAYTVGGVVLVLIFPYVSGITGVLAGLENALSTNTVIAIISVVAAVAVIPSAVRTVRGLIKRRSFLKQLEKVCSEKRYTLSEVKVPYKSLFQPYAGESFTVQTDKKTYSCKLICGMKKRIPMVLYEDGKGEYIHAFNIGRKGAQIEIFRYVKKFNFGYESEHDKIIIVLPVPKFMQMNKAGKLFDMDNGEVIGDYRMYAGTGFINALDRECVDGAKNKNLYKYI